MKISAFSSRPIGVCGIVLAAAAVSAIGSDNPALTVACGLVTALTIGLLWRLGEAPAILMAAGLQLSQVVMPVLYANLLGVPIQAVSLYRSDPTSAIWFALAALLSLVLGLWHSQLGKKPRAVSTLLLEAKSWNVQSAFVFCIVTLSLAAVFEVLSTVSEGLRQVFLAASEVQWLGVFVLAAVCVAQRRGLGFLLLVTCLEVVKGFTGYFSDFKMVFFVLLVGVFSVHPKLKPRTILGGLVAGSILLMLGAFWSATKHDYRSFANGHSAQQVIVVPIEERLGYLMNKIYESDWTTMRIGFNRLAQRWGYVDFLAATMRNVPAHVPYENGALLGAAIMHVIEPRLLFSDKPRLDDNQLTAKYAGSRFLDVGRSSGTSIGLGYVAELYIDFGVPGTIVVMFVLGLLGGRCFRFVSSSPSLPTIVNSGLAVILSTSVTLFETSLSKTVGSFVTTVIVIFALRMFLLPSLLNLFGPSDFERRHRVTA